MFLEPILAIIISNYLRRTMQKAGFSASLNKLLITCLAIAIVFLIWETVDADGSNIVAWLTHALLLYLVYIGLTQPVFRAAKSLIYAALPIIILSIIHNIIEGFVADLNNFSRKWGSYFDTAETIAIVWLFAMWFITKRQRKALERERLMALEKEKEYRITESLKAELEVQVAERTEALTQQKVDLEQTVAELKSTQAQLIQSEKMASLGELTAGIAHEIQNPLNFVNNFSEVSNELIDEMNAELDKGNLGEAKAIATDIKQNLEKIDHHGKRADAIVKSMLQHSRSSSAVKELTDINALADEYLRLSYHGLRAKDKSFNATIKTDFDNSIGEINIVPQDIGRVLLNLLTNAFYAVMQKKSETVGKENAASYNPTVTVTTKSIKLINGKPGVEIKVTDNGSGIPQNIVDKIFQPFFTTKPTGQGTGLGLSLSYDIITKAHGGELKVETKEGEGTSFIIQLPIK
jgi:two-component system NtrC family sensor kinase